MTYIALIKTKILYVIALICLVFLIPINSTFANEEQINISVFVRDTCKHCLDEKEFLKKLADEKPAVTIRYYDLAEEYNSQLFNDITSQYGLSKATPLTLVRGGLISGFSNGETTGKVITDLLNQEGNADTSFEDIINGGADVANSSGASCDEIEGCYIDNSFLVTLPIIGKTIDVGNLSLMTLSSVLGLIDGFNPCAMWVLVMFLVLLSQVNSKKKMWQFAGLFILSEAIMYYLILMVWFAVWDFVALDKIVTPLIGILALGSGVFFIYKFWIFKPVCSVTSIEQQQKVEKRATGLINKPMTLAVAIGIVGLALSVNIFEFACSIGIPQAFTKILELNQLNWLTTQAYLSLYIFAYMFDDIIVFALALYSFDKIGLTHKYSKWTTLIGGILMIALGLVMLLKPELLVI